MRTMRRGCTTLWREVFCAFEWPAERMGLVGLRGVGGSHHIRDWVRAREEQQMYNRRTPNQRHENKQNERTTDMSVGNYFLARNLP